MVVIFFISLSGYPQEALTDGVPFSFELVPVTIRQTGEQYEIDRELPLEDFMTADSALVFHDGGYFTFRLMNHSDRTLHYLIYDVIPGQSSSPLLTGYERALSVGPGDTVLSDGIYYFTEPYGCEMFALVYSEEPIINNPFYTGTYNIDVTGALFQMVPPQNWQVDHRQLWVDSLCYGIQTMCVTVSGGDKRDACSIGGLADISPGTRRYSSETAEDALLVRHLFEKQVAAHTSLMNTRANIDEKGEVMLRSLLLYFVESIYDQAIRSIPKNHKSILYHYEHDTLHYALITGNGIKASGKTGLSMARMDELLAVIGRTIYRQQDKKRLPKQKRGTRRLQGAEGDISFDSAVVLLSQQLFPPDVCRELQDTDHLEIMPEQNLGTIPYCLLQPFGNGAFLIDSLSLSISSSLFDLYSRSHQPWSGGFEQALVVGNPVYPKDPDWEFPGLPGAEKEAVAIAKITGSIALTGQEATLGRISAEAPGADLLYFATHGIADPDEALEKSFLVFAASGQDNGKWRAVDIMSAELDARLAVLSACQTGLGQTHRGGIIGLARAFREAGVPRVVMSLWSVSDEATSALMQLFMQHLEKHPPARALQLAVVEYKKSDPNVYHWGAWGLFGYGY